MVTSWTNSVLHLEGCACPRIYLSCLWIKTSPYTSKKGKVRIEVEREAS